MSENVFAFGDPKTCPFLHENIDTLYGVPAMPVERLPKVCTCGAPLTYADEVCFVEMQSPIFQETEGASCTPVELHYEELKKL